MNGTDEPAPPLTARYLASALSLYAIRKIRARTLLRALRERPIAVPGRGGSFQVDPDFGDGFPGNPR